MKILIITDGSPYPIVSSEAVRIYNIVKRLAVEHEVYLASLVYDPADIENVKEMKKLGCHVFVGVYQRRRPIAHLSRLVGNFMRGLPTELLFHQSKDFYQTIKELTSNINFDIVQIEHSYMAQYIDALLPSSKRKHILVFRNVVFDQYARIFRVAWRPLMKTRAFLFSIMMRRWEPHIAERFDLCIALSNADRALLKNANPNLEINIVPNGTDTKVNHPLPLPTTRHSLLFVGTMNYTANVDAVVFFCNEIMPLIQKVTPTVELWIVGKNPLPEVLQLADNHIHVTGEVDEVTPYYQRCNLCVVPLRAGSGTRLKILESMALGRPVVSTSIGCEGLDVINGEHIIIADNPKDFAERVIQLLTNRILYQQVSKNARELVTTRYDWDVIAQELMQHYALLAE